MKRADLYFNHYYPYYTLEGYGTKKYSHYEHVRIHLSNTKRFLFTLKYRKKKLESIEYKSQEDKGFDKHRKDFKYISYVEFAEKINQFENFLYKALRVLQNEPAYRKVLVFGQNYKFNNNYELSFDYSSIKVYTGDFTHSIKDGKLLKDRKNYLDASEEMKNLNKYLEVVDSNYKFTLIEEKEFNNDLDFLMRRYIDYLAAPKVLRKKEYKL